MLNKLLKRCMPWMDKGRWYHIGIKADVVEDILSVTNVTYDEPMFSSLDIDSEMDIVKLHFSDPTINATIIDIKTTLHMDSPDIPAFVCKPGFVPVELNNDALGYYLTVPVLPGTIDAWLFIKTN